MPGFSKVCGGVLLVLFLVLWGPGRADAALVDELRRQVLRVVDRVAGQGSRGGDGGARETHYDPESTDTDILAEIEDMLYLQESKRDIKAAVRGLLELSSELYERVLPAPGRRELRDPQLNAKWQRHASAPEHHHRGFPHIDYAALGLEPPRAHPRQSSVQHLVRAHFWEMDDSTANVESGLSGTQSPFEWAPDRAASGGHGPVDRPVGAHSDIGDVLFEGEVPLEEVSTTQAHGYNFAHPHGHGLIAFPGEDFQGLAANADALFLLAALSASGVLSPLVPLDDRAAVEALHIAARTGSREASVALADRYLHGRGVPKSCHEAAARYARESAAVAERAQSTGDHVVPQQPVLLRERHRDNTYEWRDWQNSDEQVMFEEGRATQGDPEAMRSLGYRKLTGEGTEVDTEGAFQYFQQGADMGDGYSAFNLGYMYMRGEHPGGNGVPDYQAARQQFLRAGERGVPAAWNGLGALTSGGTGVPQNHTAAVEFFRRGAELGDPDSMINLGTYYMEGVAGAVQKNSTAARRYFQDAMDHGHWKAPFLLGMLSMPGTGRGTGPAGRVGGWFGEGDGPPTGPHGLEANCTEATHMLRTFLSERMGWADDMEAAMDSVDAGDVWGGVAAYAFVAEQGAPPAVLNLAFLLQRHGVALGIRPQGEAGSPEEASRSAGALVQQLALRLYMRAGAAGYAEGYTEAGNVLYSAPASGLKLEGAAAAAAETEGGAAHTHLKLAARMYARGADKSDPEALHSLAWMHARGKGVKQDRARARELYAKLVWGPEFEHIGSRVVGVLGLLQLWALETATVAGLLDGVGGAAGEAGAAVAEETAALLVLAGVYGAIVALRGRRQQAMAARR
ncbi:unnamed protein product [Pedinophyceae sp. YPF-701]|nr:unnamed protein product [Pedinophyceae sp. YPF-701]